MDRGRVFSNKSDIMRMVVGILEEERVDYSLPASKGGQVCRAAEVLFQAGRQVCLPDDGLFQWPIQMSVLEAAAAIRSGSRLHPLPVHHGLVQSMHTDV